MSKLSSADLARRKISAREIVAGLNLTQHAYGKIIAGVNILREWDDGPVLNDNVRAFNRLFTEIAASYSEGAEDPLPSSDELFVELFVIWAMQSNWSRKTGIPHSIHIRGNQRPWWRDAITEFLAMVRGQDVEIVWLNDLFQQFADEPPSKTKKRRQIANVATADQPRLLRRTLVEAPPAANDVPPSREVAKRKQDCRDTPSSSATHPSKKIKPQAATLGDQSNVTSGTGSTRTNSTPPPRASQQPLATSSSVAISATNFGLGLPKSFDSSTQPLAAQDGRDLVGHPQTEPPPTRDVTASIDWHPEHIKVKKERDELASKLAEANKKLEKSDSMISELRKDLVAFLDSAHDMLQGLNAIDLQRKKMRAAAVKLLLSHSSNAAPPQQAAAPTTADHNSDAASTTRDSDLQGQSVPGHGPDIARE